ncbi:MAG: hypothetical protein PWR17_243 [Candidatus Methanomethylophilaceae archaeon]|nr:hypothetical protein [Candidatus Methanomethylophilaceae archaeon]
MDEEGNDAVVPSTTVVIDCARYVDAGADDGATIPNAMIAGIVMAVTAVVTAAVWAYRRRTAV